MSAAGATKARKSEGDIHDGTARTATIVCCSPYDCPSGEDCAKEDDILGDFEVEAAVAVNACMPCGDSLKICTIPSGKLVVPDDCDDGSNTATEVSK